MLTITDAQRNFIESSLAKKKEQIFKGTASFKLNREQCKRYFNVIDDTLHGSTCYVKDRMNDKVLVEAIFFGSGVFSHPVRTNWVPVSEIKVEPSIFILLILSLFNLLTQFPTHLFHGRRNEIWTFNKITDDGNFWISHSTVSCKKCCAKKTVKFAHPKKQEFDDMELGSTREEVIHKVSNWTFEHNGYRVKKDK